MQQAGRCGIGPYGCARSKETEAGSERADVGIGPYGCARSKETEGCSRRADVGIGPYGMGVFGIL